MRATRVGRAIVLGFVIASLCAVTSTRRAHAAVARPFPDFNRDGVADVVSSIDQQDIGATVDAGAVEVLYGSPFTSGTIAHHQYISNSDTTLKGDPTTGGRFGENWAAGDFNGDGYDDLAIGEYGATISGHTDAGQVHILYGGPNGLTTAGYQNVNQDTSGVQDAAETGDEFGHSVATGDVNGDGFADLVVSVPREDLNGASQVGAVHVFFGSVTGLAFAQTKGALFFHQGANGGGLGDAAELNDIFGSPVSTADLDHDGRADVEIGVQGETLGDAGTPGPTTVAGAGGFYVLYGDATKANLGKRFQFFTENSSGMPNAPSAGDRFGAYFAASDFNGDGYLDLAVGADGEKVGTVTNAGAAYVFKGGPTGITTAGVKRWDLSSMTALGQTPRSADNFGDALAAGDYNGDGKGDLVITVDRRDLKGLTGIDHGEVLVVKGSATGLTMNGVTVFTENTAGMPGGPAAGGDQYGSMAKEGDFNGDGIDDLSIAAGGKTVAGQTHAGAVYLMPGSVSGLSVAGTVVYTQGSHGIEGAPQANAWFGGT